MVNTLNLITLRFQSILTKSSFNVLIFEAKRAAYVKKLRSKQMLEVPITSVKYWVGRLVILSVKQGLVSNSDILDMSL